MPTDTFIDDVAIDSSVDTSPVRDLFTAYHAEAATHYTVHLAPGCTPEAYTAIDTSAAFTGTPKEIADAKSKAKRAIYVDAKDVLLRLGCSTFGVRLISKVLFSIVKPKATDDHRNTLAHMLGVPDYAFSNMVGTLESAAEKAAVKAYIEADFDDSESDDADSNEVGGVIKAAKDAIVDLRKVRQWSNNFKANMATVQRAVAVVAAKGGSIDDYDGASLKVSLWAYILMSGKGITVKGVRMADKRYARAHKAAHCKSKK